ncbi:Addiction module component, CHP02574 [Candidatus Magnetomorum sp. HK-1]|nr:Addiction module component, CHP02574 [Candidatus Magnetomorum sp. HK-1]
MYTITANDTLSLSIPERIQLVQDIWDTIFREDNSDRSIQVDTKLIDERLEAHRQNPDAGSSWEEVYNRIMD